MAKIRFFFLQLLFLGAPLIYAWFYIPFLGIDVSILAKYVPGLSWSWFESVKVTFLFFCVFWASLFHLISLFWKKKPKQVPVIFFTALIVFFAWTAVALFINQNNVYFSFGNHEKHHGWFFYIALLTLFFLLRQNSPSDHKKLITMSFLWCTGVALYSFFQVWWLDPLRDAYETRLDLQRIFSTLGNPNYLAGLVLMILPLMHETLFRHKGEHKALWDILLWIVWGVLIYWTGSYLAWIFFALYVLIVIVNHIITQSHHRYIFWSFFTVCIFLVLWLFWYYYSEDILALQKMQGFIARFYLWKTWVAALTNDISHFLFWYGPDGFLVVSERFRHPLLSVYEDPAYRIDRSHNVFLDFALHFGVVLLGIILFLLSRIFKYFSRGQQLSLLFFALYFSFNIPVLVHFLLVLQIVASCETKKIIHR